MPKAQATLPIVTTKGDLGANIASFVRHLKAENKSPRTIQTYWESASQFAAYLQRTGMPTDVARLTRDPVEAFITHLLETRKPATANVRYRGLQAFIRWLIDEGEIKDSPVRNMKPPKLRETLVPVLTEDQIVDLRIHRRYCGGAGLPGDWELSCPAPTVIRCGHDRLVYLPGG